MKFWPQLLMGLMMAVSSWAAIAQESAEQWLQKMVTASHEASFQGRLVLLSGGRLISLAVYHASINGEVWERVVHLSGEPAEIIRQGGSTLSVHHLNATQLTTAKLYPMGSSAGKWDSIQQGIQAASGYYRFKLVGEDRVADRAAVLIEVEPLDLHRYGYTLWLDEQSGVLLRSQTNPLRGDPLEIFEFVQLNIDESLSAKDFHVGENLDLPEQKRLREAGQPMPPTDNSWQIAWVPDGFVEASNAVFSQDHSDVSVRTYSDGLAAFTVFYEAIGAPVAESTSTRGATVAVNRNLKKSLVTVVGEIPAATAEKIADNVKILAANALKR